MKCLVCHQRQKTFFLNSKFIFPFRLLMFQLLFSWTTGQLMFRLFPETAPSASCGKGAKDILTHHIVNQLTEPGLNWVWHSAWIHSAGVGSELLLGTTSNWKSKTMKLKSPQVSDSENDEVVFFFDNPAVICAGTSGDILNVCPVTLLWSQDSAF